MESQSVGLHTSLIFDAHYIQVSLVTFERYPITLTANKSYMTQIMTRLH